ncbi:polymer-forming cytoskeletal protein [[Clostridium] fimetarium]|uniref:Protein CcmA, bactofilin family n=1 Tax=[Clostridium] fimetarium TaxID=99656 RepID=A0A1I0N3E7_9FIRM|nr:polymer-forming cytoskeletal protein [[Clostridium] fimetarium]SEV95341.1 protein CcmA, bactofilin family [[Clostridium] fimetarium]
MGFFKDFKEDLSQAVNDLVTEPETEKTKDEDVMVNTLDDASISDMAASIEKEAMDSIESSIKADNLIESLAADIKSEVGISANDIEEDDEDVIDETAVITKGLSVIGDLNSKGSIDLFGFVEGNVICKGKLTVSGSIVGDSKAAEVFANNAQIEGNIEAYGSIKIGQGSVIVGNIAATSAVIAGAVKGDIDIQGPVIIDASAVIVGDIKSKSVQINNGATIEGRCSQCYADINANAIFDKKKK